VARQSQVLLRSRALSSPSLPLQEQQAIPRVLDVRPWRMRTLPMATIQVGLLMDIYGPYVVTAYKVDRQIKDAGLHHFGPFESEDEAQTFADTVASHPEWELSEVPVLNKPEVFGTGEERL